MTTAISILFIIGILISKEFRTGFFNMVGAAIVFTPVIVFGIIYSTGHAIYLTVKERKIKLLGYYIWRLIDGAYASLGDAMKYGFAYRYDELGNVYGEWVEDSTTSEEATTFGDKQTTISASIGFLEYSDLKQTRACRILSRALNLVFRQKRHTIGSWEKKLALKELRDKNLHGNLN